MDCPEEGIFTGAHRTYCCRIPSEMGSSVTHCGGPALLERCWPTQKEQSTLYVREVSVWGKEVWAPGQLSYRSLERQDTDS